MSHRRRMNRAKARPKQFKRCAINNCTNKQEIELERNKKPIPACWMHGYILLQQAFAGRVDAQTLFDRVPDNCYRCTPMDLLLENSEYLIVGFKQKVAELTNLLATHVEKITELEDLLDWEPEGENIDDSPFCSCGSMLKNTDYHEGTCPKCGKKWWL